jgi:glucosamine-6-phosphate deaminase
MRVRTFGVADHASEAVARIVARQLKARPDSVLGLPTGRTAAPVYDALVRMEPDFSRARTFNLDEFLGVPARDPRSLRAFMERRLFQRVNLPDRHIHFLDGAVGDVAAECARFERAIARAGGIDLMLLGIGRNGHIGFNEPGAALFTGTHQARLTTSTRRANAAAFGGRIAAVPREALSMGMGTILSARAIVLVATGRTKARAIRATLSGRVTTRVPSSLLQLHTDVTLIIDRDAASRIAP